MIRVASTALLCGVTLFLPVAYAATAADAPVDARAEITVTTEKTTQTLLKTAAAITAISADTIIEAGVEDLRQAQKLVPSYKGDGAVTAATAAAYLEDPKTFGAISSGKY